MSSHHTLHVICFCFKDSLLQENLSTTDHLQNTAHHRSHIQTFEPLPRLQTLKPCLDNAPKSHSATTTWEQKLQDLILGFDDNQPRFRHEKWRSVFDSQLSSNPFTIATSTDPLFALPLAENVEKWSVWLTEEALWDRLSTLSQIAVLEGEEREKVRSVIREALKGDDVQKNEKGEVELHGMTVAAWTTKIPQKGAEGLFTTVKDALAGRT
jgi:hypothetical protein